MKEYLVKSGNDYKTVYADDVVLEFNELTFFKNENEIAVFQNWDYWIDSTALEKDGKNENQHS